MYVAAARRSECHRESPPPRGYSGSLIVSLFWFTASPPRCPVCTRPEDKVFFFKKKSFWAHGLCPLCRSHKSNCFVQVVLTVHVSGAVSI